MDIEKLIEQLNARGLSNGSSLGYHCGLYDEAATTLSTLRAELERVKAERDAAIKDIWVPKWISCKHGENCGFISAVTGMPDCTGCADWEWRGQKEE